MRNFITGAALSATILISGCSSMDRGQSGVSYEDIESGVQISSLMVCDSQLSKMSDEDLVRVKSALAAARAVIEGGELNGMELLFSSLTKLNTAQSEAVKIAFKRVLARAGNFELPEQLKLAVTAIDYCLMGLGEPVAK